MALTGSYRLDIQISGVVASDCQILQHGCGFFGGRQSCGENIRGGPVRPMGCAGGSGGCLLGRGDASAQLAGYHRTVGRRDNVTESRILQGRDPRSIRVPVPDGRGLDQNFNDVTIVDMGDLPESHVSMPELGEFIQKWPPAVINHMMWRQRELEHLWLKGSLDRNIPRLARFAAQSLRMVCIDMWLAAI